jgi:hypothetical protein
MERFASIIMVAILPLVAVRIFFIRIYKVSLPPQKVLAPLPHPFIGPQLFCVVGACQNHTIYVERKIKDLQIYV